jgi:hypothetical protein
MTIGEYIKKYRRNILFSTLIILLLVTGVAVYLLAYRINIGPEQPIHFSHRVHTTDKQISCLMCHDEAPKANNAGIPPLQTCMLCHERIIIHHPEIENLRNHFYSNQPVLWSKVTDLPDFVYFPHRVHLYRKIDCSECHGNVKQMDRIKYVQDFKMGFCIDCHKSNNATTDCFSCHR